MTTPSTPYRAPEPPEEAPILVTTGPDVPGHRVTEILGVVHGCGYREFPLKASKVTELHLAGRREALAALTADASKLGAHAVVAMRYETITLNGVPGEILAYGTAVRFEPNRPDH